ncbi:translation initiation factor IF-2-like [Antechinus flavipes]|uniref:translation initiation factor IF-2-like n=1 Tax=Antechinus flavipes TaxID=38775 RepID=UPI0022361BAC|nr:translation initiation factor IF-2-like [Antechinus flavipes]
MRREEKQKKGGKAGKGESRTQLAAGEPREGTLALAARRTGGVKNRAAGAPGRGRDGEGPLWGITRRKQGEAGELRAAAESQVRNARCQGQGEGKPRPGAAREGAGVRLPGAVSSGTCPGIGSPRRAAAACLLLERGDANRAAGRGSGQMEGSARAERQAGKGRGARNAEARRRINAWDETRRGRETRTHTWKNEARRETQKRALKEVRKIFWISIPSIAKVTTYNSFCSGKQLETGDAHQLKNG